MHRHFGILLQHLLIIVGQLCCLLQGGASLRLLHPQRYFPHLAQRMAHLEELFNGCIGCNAYLTPPDSQVCCYSHHLPYPAWPCPSSSQPQACRTQAIVTLDVQRACSALQGFAPHWDDIDAFILQLEGAKR